MGTYANGALPATVLVPVPGNPGLYLLPAAAAAWGRLASAVLARYGWRPTLTDAYRSYDAQVRVFLERYRFQLVGSGPFGDVRWWQGKRYVRFTGPSAAVPGTSNHGLGETVDVRDMTSFTSTTFRDFMSVAAEHGWSNAEGRSVGEPWHQHWFAAADRHVNDVVTTLPTVTTVPTLTPLAPLTPTVQEDDMLLRDSTTGAVVLLSGGRTTAILGADYAAYLAAHIPVVGLSHDGFLTACRDFS